MRPSVAVVAVPRNALVISAHPLYSIGLVVMAGLALVMIFFLMRSAGRLGDAVDPPGLWGNKLVSPDG